MVRPLNIDRGLGLFYNGEALQEAVARELPPRFTIRRRLGEGGTGLVYEAWDAERETPVALKILTRVTAGSVYRFKNEFRSLCHVSHRNLIVLHELFSSGEQWFLTMDLVEGVDFLAWVREGEDRQLLATAPSPSPFDDWLDEMETERQGSRGRMPVHEGRLRDALRQLTEGLGALHAAGFLHRDIKPSNVLVGQDSRVVVLDFGLVRDEDEIQQTLEERVIGTPAYMSPEQARGEPTTTASDWYATGVMLYQALTGFLPFSGSVLQVLSSKQMRDPPDPRVLADDIPADLAELAMALLQRRADDRPDVRAVRRWLTFRTASRATPVPPRPSTPPRAPFVGREAELAALREAYEQARAGHAVVAQVHGRSGFGKTALIRHFVSQLREEGDAIVLVGRCYERESVPYKAFDDVVDSLTRFLRRLDPAEVAVVLPEDVGALVRVFPVLRRVEVIARETTAAASDSTLDLQELRQRAFAALRKLLWRLGRHRPVAVFIDDLQWGDADSAHLLRTVLGVLEPPALLLVGTYRTEEREESPLLRRLGRMWSAAGPKLQQHEITVDRLRETEAHELAELLLTEGDLDLRRHRETVVREADGSPLFVGELVRFIRERAEPAGTLAPEVRLSDVLVQRLDALPAAARELLDVVCIIGQPVPPGLAAKAAGIRRDAPGAFVALRAAHFIRAGWSRGVEVVEPYHDRIRELVIGLSSAPRRRVLHGRLAEALERSGAEPEQLAVHLEAAGERERAVRYVIEGAAQAARTLAFDRAAELYGHALSLRTDESAERGELEEALADSLARAGRSAEAAEAYLRAAVRLSDDRRLDLERRAAEHLLRSGHVDSGLDAMKKVLEPFGMRLAGSPGAAVRRLLMWRARLKLRGLHFEERPASEVAEADLRRIDTCWSVAAGLTMVDVLQAADFQARLLFLALEAGEPHRVARALALEAGHRIARDARQEGGARELLDRTEALARRLGDPHSVGLVLAVRGVGAALVGRWREAHDLTAKADTIFRERCTNVAWERTTALRFRLISTYFLGRIAELTREAPEMLEDAEARGDLYAVECARSGVAASAWLAQDRSPEIRAYLEDSAQRWSGQNVHLQHLLVLQGLVHVDLYDGQAEAAYARILEWWKPLKRARLLDVQHARIILRSDRALCALASATDGQDERVREAAQIARRLEREQLPLSRALAMLVRAGVAQRQERDDHALELLAEGEVAFSHLEMRLFVACIQHVRGRLMGGDQGDALRAEATSFLRGEGVERPEAVVRAVVPF